MSVPLASFWNKTKLSGVDISEGKDTIQRDVDRLEEWSHVNLMMFTKSKCKVHHLGWGNPQQQYKLGDKWIESKEGLGDVGR